VEECEGEEESLPPQAAVVAIRQDRTASVARIRRMR